MVFFQNQFSGVFLFLLFSIFIVCFTLFLSLKLGAYNPDTEKVSVFEDSTKAFKIKLYMLKFSFLVPYIPEIVSAFVYILIYILKEEVTSVFFISNIETRLINISTTFLICFLIFRIIKRKVENKNVPTLGGQFSSLFKSLVFLILGNILCGIFLFFNNDLHIFYWILSFIFPIIECQPLDKPKKLILHHGFDKIWKKFSTEEELKSNFFYKVNNHPVITSGPKEQPVCNVFTHSKGQNGFNLGIPDLQGNNKRKQYLSKIAFSNFSYYY
jgi:hypothetical protein